MTSTQRAALNDAMEIVALTEDRARQLVAPVLEEIIGLRDHKVPEHKIGALIGALRKCCEYNDEVNARAHALCGKLEQPPGALTVRSIVKAVRPALAVLRDPLAHTITEYVAASCALRTIVDRTPREVLLNRSVLHNLGPAAARELVSFVDGDAAQLLEVVVDPEAVAA